MAVMFCGSTDLLSAEHTSRFLTPILRWLKPNISAATVAQVHFLVRKAAHLAEYAILTGLLFRALSGLMRGFWVRASVALVPALIFALADEFHQSFVASRTSSLGDVFIDFGGALLGVGILALIRRPARDMK
jgi:VanZ family protein